MSRTLFGALALLLAVGIAGCGRSNDSAPPADVSVTVTVAPEPAVVGPASLTVTLKDTTGAAIEGATVKAKGDMTHAGMTPVLATLAPSAAGTYAGPFEWTMGGDWIVSIDVTLADGRTFTHKLDFNVKGGT